MDAHRERKDGVVHITKAELLNGAFVPIPSNRLAMVLSAKSYADRIDPVTDHEQQVDGVALHNLALAYGVDCVIDG